MQLPLAPKAQTLQFGNTCAVVLPAQAPHQAQASGHALGATDWADGGTISSESRQPSVGITEAVEVDEEPQAMQSECAQQEVT